MKRFAVAAAVLSLFAAGCDEKLNPVAPTPGQVTLASQLAGSANVPPASSLEAGSAGTLSVAMTPAAGGAYTASFTFQIGGLVKAGLLPAPLDSGSVILAGYIHQGAAGTVGPPVVQLPISLQAPIVTPTGSVAPDDLERAGERQRGGRHPVEPVRVLLQHVLGAEPERRDTRPAREAVASRACRALIYTPGLPPSAGGPGLHGVAREAVCASWPARSALASSSPLPSPSRVRTRRKPSR